MRTSTVGTIQIAATPTLADNLLPPAVALFQQARPKVRVTIHAMDNYNVVNHVVREYVDFGLALVSVRQHRRTRDRAVRSRTGLRGTSRERIGRAV